MSDARRAPPSPQPRDRRSALDDAIDTARRLASRCGLGLAARDVGDGTIVLALAGTVDQGGRARLDRWVERLDTVGAVELTVDLGGLTDCDDRCARTLGRLRVRLLVAGMRLRWCRVPDRLTDHLRAGVAETFVVDA